MRALAALAVALGVLAPGAAAAHAVLVATAPADRAVVGDAPPQLSLRFNEPVEPVAVRLIDGAGHAVAAEVTAANETVRVVPAAPLAGGAYIVSWRVISADAHPVSGAFQFAVGGEPPPWRTAPDATGKGASWFAIAVVNRALHLIALALALGGALYGVLIGAAPRRVVLWGAGVAAVTAILAVGFEGGLVLDVPLARLLDPEIWRVGAGTSRGIASAVAVLGLAAIAARQAVAGATLVVASFALSGHVATAPPRILAVPALLIHAGIALIWLGAFVPLLRAAPGEGARFGRLARWAVRGLVLAGLVIAAIQVREWSPLVQTGYGVILLLKAALAAALIFLVARMRTRPRGAGSVAGALALGCAILAATAILTETAPPRSRAPEAVVLSAATASGRLVATVTVTPATAGRNTISVAFADSSGVPVSPRAADALVSNPTAGIEAIVRPLVRGDDGVWRHEGPELAVVGEWTLRIEALVGDFERAAVSVRVPVR